MRVVAMLRALADAGHRVDLVAPYSELPEHPHIRVLTKNESKSHHRTQLRLMSLRTAHRVSYDAVHAVDEAVFFAMRLCRWKKIPFVYDAARCFSGKTASGASGLGWFFPKHIQRMEAKVLERASMIFSSCSALTADLHGMDKSASVIQLEDIPAQPLYARQDVEKATLLKSFGKDPGPVVVCYAQRGHAVGFRQLLMASRKVIESMPDAIFFFKGPLCGQAKKMATNLDIASHCVFLSAGEPEAFLSVVEIADATLLVTQENGRYIHPQVYTLLRAGAPLVTVHDAAYDELLTEQTSVRVLPNSESIAEGLLRVIQEPLFSLAIAVLGQQLVAENHTYSSFKHKVRMSYHQLTKPD